MKLQENLSLSSLALKEILKWNIQVEEKYLDRNIKINSRIKKKPKRQICVKVMNIDCTNN